MDQLSLPQARQIALRAQGLDRRRRPHVSRLLAQLGAVQLDTISVLARSHELVSYARLGAVGRTAVERALWGNGRTFEYWSHAACVLPATVYPYFAFRRRGFIRSRDRWSTGLVESVRTALEDRGPLTATELGGARESAGWWNWSQAKEAAEWMLATGAVVVTDRRSWRRLYDLPERALQIEPQSDWVEEGGIIGPSDEQCLRFLLRDAVRSLGIGTWADIKDVHRLRNLAAVMKQEFAYLLEAGEVEKVSVAGWDEPTYADPAALRRIGTIGESVTTLLSPFDSLIWHRPRLERLFGLRLRIEAYTPKAQREHGYFSMPVLHQGRIVGLVDPAREGDVLVARRATGGDAKGVATALAEAAAWVGSTSVRVDESTISAKHLTVMANRLLKERE